MFDTIDGKYQIERPGLAWKEEGENTNTTISFPRLQVAPGFKFSSSIRFPFNSIESSSHSIPMEGKKRKKRRIKPEVFYESNESITNHFLKT